MKQASLILCIFVCAVQLLPGSVLSAAAENSADQGRLPLRQSLQLVQQGECSERIGPFATQDSAWQNLRQTESQGYGVSGVFPCYDSYGSRGYCFNVFYPC